MCAKHQIFTFLKSCWMTVAGKKETQHTMGFKAFTAELDLHKYKRGGKSYWNKANFRRKNDFPVQMVHLREM